MAHYRSRHLERSPARRRRRPVFVVVLGAIALAVTAGLGIASTRTDHTVRASNAPALPSTSVPTPARPETTVTTAAPRREATVAFAGDVLIHSGVWAAAQTPDGYDFAPMLAPVAPQLSAADLAICHLEVTLARPEDPLSGFPRFRAPRPLAAGLASSGFDGCSVASNHALDFGEQGVVATLDALDEVGLGHAGTARSPAEDAQPARYAPGGIAVAHLSYAYGFNGFSAPTDKRWLVDQIDPVRVLADANAARAAGAEFVIVSLHWGNEYTHDVVPAQQAVADALAASPGTVDLIVGHHAHVVQPITKVGSMWVVWGMGNLLSNNSPSCCLDDATDGVIVTVSIGDGGGPEPGVEVTGITFTPTWNERATFRVLPIAATLSAGAPAPLADDLRRSYARTLVHVLARSAEALGVTPDQPVPPE